MLTWEEFDAVDMRVGRIVEVEVFVEARKPSYLLQVNFGDSLGVTQSSAAIRETYTEADLLGRLVVAVTNFPPKQIANHRSEVLILAAVNQDGSLRLLQPDQDVALGARIR
jgi:tRNA-binding protein